MSPVSASQVLPKTPPAIRAAVAAAGAADRFIWSQEVPGFGLRARGGKATWIHQYRDSAGETRRLRLGAWPALSYAGALEAVQRNVARITLGEDPAAARDTAREIAKGADRIGTLIERFLAAPPRPWKPRTAENMRHYLGRLCAPLHGRTTLTLAAADVRDLLAQLAVESGPVSRNRVRSALVTWARWAAGYGYIQPEVAGGIVMLPKLAETARDRVPGKREIRALWRAAGDDDYGRIVKLLILTACRRNEIAGLKAGEIDRAGKRITVPPDRTKTGEAHDVPLTAAVLELLPEARKGRQHLFGEGEGDTAFSGWSRCWERTWRRIIEADADMPPFTLHDLRRGFSTWANDQKDSDHIAIEAVLGHSIGSGSSGVYNRSTMLAKKRTALTAWQRQVAAWVR